MASSRWKRFAFFDRQTLSLPNDVVDDLMPTRGDGDPSSMSSRLGSVAASAFKMSIRRKRIEPLPDAGDLFPDEDDDEVSGHGTGEYFSLVATTASLPFSTDSAGEGVDDSAASPSGPERGGDVKSASAASASSTVRDDRVKISLMCPAPNLPKPSGNVLRGVSGMASALKACHAAPLSPGGASTTSSSSSAARGAVRIPGRGTTPYAAAAVGAAAADREAATPAPAGDSAVGDDAGNADRNGLVLLFLSSRSTNLVHCVDVTVRTSRDPSPPPGTSPSEGAMATGGYAPGAGSAAVDEELTNLAEEALAGSEAEPEDWDGWRGCFDPFASMAATEDRLASGGVGGTRLQDRIVREHMAPSTKGNGGGSRIVGLAAHNSVSTGSVRVAAITDDPLSPTTVAVLKDPHWNLSSRSLRSPPASEDDRETQQRRGRWGAVSCVPTSEFDFERRGKPRSVDVRDGLVAVGTDAGVVVVYSYPTKPTAAVTAAGAGKKSGKDDATLTFVMEIPPPPSAASAASSGDGNEGGKPSVTCVKLVTSFPSSSSSSAGGTKDKGKGEEKGGGTVKLYVCYRRHRPPHDLDDDKNKRRSESTSAATKPTTSSTTTKAGSAGGVCCYDLGIKPPVGGGVDASRGGVSWSSSSAGGASARYDLDGRDAEGGCLCDVAVAPTRELHLMVARPDGLYTYSHAAKDSVTPVGGTKIVSCSVPPPASSRRMVVVAAGSSSSSETSDAAGGGRKGGSDGAKGEGGTATAAKRDGTERPSAGASYALVATTDSKSGRDAVDIYDATNKLVAFHVLLSPGHRALRASGVTAFPFSGSDGTTRGGRSSAIVLTSGGSIVTLTEKVTSEKVNLLVQKNLYSAAISMAYADPSYQPSDVTALYRRHAEHLYRKSDFAAAMEQYIYTIGSLEPSHVIFRYLDAPKIPLLARYLEVLRSRDLATPVHDELLRTCYLKLNDVVAAEKIAASAASTSQDASSCASIVSRIAHDPAEALATICSFEAPQAAEALVVHCATLARALPRETAGVVVSLCTGTYSPSALADAAAGGKSSSSPSSRRHGKGGGGGGGGDTSNVLDRPLSSSDDDVPKVCDMYPVHLFSSAFLENPKLLRLILAHCNRRKCMLGPSLRRTLLELTLEEWNAAKQIGDTEVEKLRRDEAMAALTDSHMDDIGEYEALVIVQLAGFAEGEVLLYERLQMAPLLLERYAKDGGERARRQMLAMCRTDPELLADVLGYFVGMASDKIGQDGQVDDGSEFSEAGGEAAEEILDDIREALYMARAQGVLPPVRIARILGGEGVGQFSVDAPRSSGGGSDRLSVPLSVALDYVGATLDESSKKIARLKADVEEYNQLCNSMESEIEELLASSAPLSMASEESKQSAVPHVNIEEMYAKLRESLEEGDGGLDESQTESAQEEFWREMGHSEDRFETIARFFGKGIIQ